MMRGVRSDLWEENLFGRWFDSWLLCGFIVLHEPGLIYCLDCFLLPPIDKLDRDMNLLYGNGDSHYALEVTCLVRLTEMICIQHHEVNRHSQKLIRLSIYLFTSNMPT
jgi:hypothetical protein